MNSINQILILVPLLASIGFLPPVEGQGEAAVAPPGEIKCTCSPCGSCNNPSQPPPSPPPPSPPPSPASPPPPSPYLPTPSQPSKQYCPPPPPFQQTPPYSLWAPPGNLYPVDPHYQPSSARRNFSLWLILSLGTTLVTLCL